MKQMIFNNQDRLMGIAAKALVLLGGALVALSLALAMSGCTDSFRENDYPRPWGNSEGDDDDLVPVEFTLSSQRNHDFTRAESSIVSFNSGETIKVFVSTNGGSSYTDYDYTTAAAGQEVGLTAPAPPPYFPDGPASTVQAYAYYPATAGASATFSVADNQTSDAAYKSSDLMYAANRTITKGSSEGTKLQMAHKMVQLCITASAASGSDLSIYKVKVNAKKSVTFTPADGTATATGDNGDVIALTQAGTGYVLIPPQLINNVTIKIETDEVGSSQGTATFGFASTSSFEAGNSYSLDLTVSPSQLGTTTAITDWNGAGSVVIGATGDLTIGAISAETYDGTAHTPGLTVKKGETTLTLGSDYSVQYLNNTNAGTAYAVVIGEGTYNGSVGVAAFTINPKTLTDGMVSSIEAQTYTRSQITPAVTVTDGSALTLNNDYTISYGENINVASGGSATVTGTGNYTGTVVRNFTISPKNISGMTLNLSQTSASYTGSAITASVSSLMDSEYVLTATTEYIIDGASVTSATNAAASAGADVTQNTITVNGTGNYTGSKSATWHINRVAPTLTISSYSPNPMNLTMASATGTINVSRSGDGAVTATSSATSVATTSVTETTVTVTAVADGSATITVKMNQGTNYTAYTATDKTVSVSSSGFIVAPALGDKYYSDGSWGNNAHASGATVIGVVAWLGSDSNLKCGKSHGLVIGKEDASSSSVWGGYGNDESFLYNCSSIADCQDNDKNGLTNTQKLNGGTGGCSHGHAAASAAAGYAPATPAAPTSNGATQWFLPSAAQWLAVMGPNGIGGYTGTFAWAGYASSSTSVVTNINNRLTATGVGGTGLATGASYWSSSELNSNYAVLVGFDSSSGVYVIYNYKSYTYRVRAFLAF